ncbi:shikimate kinase [Thermophilibacter sp.]
MADGERGAATTAPFGLVGHPLGHSWSPQIHERLGSAPYELHDLAPDEVRPFVRDGAWSGLNVTIPYKREAAELADERSERVERLGVANTLVRRSDGTIFAENTDVLGFAWMLERFCRRELGGDARGALAGRETLVLGSGGAAQAVVAALEGVGARVVVVSRRGPETYDGLAARHPDAALLVNTTPVGMYPNCPASPLDDGELAALGGLRGVLDVVYNPARTGICLVAERLGLPFESGLAMLVAQARFSSELFQGRALDDALVERIEGELRARTENVVLIGMPGAGKTSCGRALARRLGRPFADVDETIRAERGRSAAQIIREDGEEAFRAVESDVTARLGARSGLIVACGGGVVERAENYDALHQNGRIVLLDRPLEELSDAGRPVSQDRGVERLAAERMGRYRAWADVTLRCTGSPESDAAALAGLLGL